MSKDIASSHSEIDEQVRQLQNARATSLSDAQRVGMSNVGSYSGDMDASEDYNTSIGAADGDDDDDADSGPLTRHGVSASQKLIDEVRMHGGSTEDALLAGSGNSKKIIERESDYQKRRFNRMISPERTDMFVESTPNANERSYSDVMQDQMLANEKAAVMKKIEEQKQADAIAAAAAEKKQASDAEGPKRRSNWDMPTPDLSSSSSSSSDAKTANASASRWDATPQHSGSTAGTSRWDSTDGGATPKRRKSRWDATPTIGDDAQRKSRWDATPVVGDMSSVAATPNFANMDTPQQQFMATPTQDQMQQQQQQAGNMTPADMQRFRWEQELGLRNKPLTDEELDAILPKEGYTILEVPASYQPIHNASRNLYATPTPMSGESGFSMQLEGRDMVTAEDLGMKKLSDESLPALKPEDEAHFAKLMQDVDEGELDADAKKERIIMKHLLRIKNGTPPMRKSAMRQLTDNARKYGPGPLFNQILPLLMSPSLEDQERHFLVKLVDRILYKLDDLVRPYVHKILVVIEPLLIDEDYYARIEGREIISNLAKASGLATMISVMRPDLDNTDDYVRNVTAHAFAVVASALGIPALLPFLKAVCRSKRSWHARHTGIKIVYRVAILMGCAVLPYLRSLVSIIEDGLKDQETKVKMMTGLALAALAEAAAPYGIESFDSVIVPLWQGSKEFQGKTLSAFLKAIGYIIPLMDPDAAFYYTKEVMLVLIRHFQASDDEMKKIVLKVVKQCCATDGVTAQYIREEILDPFFQNFWNVRMALDRRNYRQLVQTTVELSNKVGASDIVSRLVEDLKDENEVYRKMVVEAIHKVLENLGASDIDKSLEQQLMDGMLFAFQEQTIEDDALLNGFGAVVKALGLRTKDYLPQICGTILWRLNNKSAKVRQQAADLVSRIAVVMMECDEIKLLNNLGVVLYEYLGEEYPEVLGSILGGLKAIVNVVGMKNMKPPIKDLLPRLTPILRNRHEKVQENCIDLVGRIADRGPEYVSSKEWMRICFELLELLKAQKKAIRRATVNTFGYIAKAIGPSDVLVTLLNNLKVQERQLRVCTTVAIAIVAETCAPFTVLPGLMNEYSVPEMNVQNGVLKSLSFLFEYIGEMGKDYVYAVTPMLEDALMDRDHVHRQTACTTIKHMALGVYGLGREDALQHLLNFVWPNIFETSLHMIGAAMDAISAMRVALGPARILCYVLQGLFHPARKVRQVYWKIYNNLYVGSQDALVSAFPSFEDEGEQKYSRHELEYVL